MLSNINNMMFLRLLYMWKLHWPNNGVYIKPVTVDSVEHASSSNGDLAMHMHWQSRLDCLQHVLSTIRFFVSRSSKPKTRAMLRL